MATYTYLAKDVNGRDVRGSALADTEDALAASLREKGQYLISAAPDRAALLSEVRLFERVTRRDLIFFTTQLATILATGVSIVEGLQDLEGEITKLRFRRIITSLRHDIEAGLSLSAALARHSRVFSEIYVNVVRAGEATGRADRALEDLAAQLEWQDDLASQIREVLTYPVIVLLLLSGLTTVLVGFTIPRFASIYERLGAQMALPLPTRVVVMSANFLRNNWYIILVAVATAFIFARVTAGTEEGRVKLARVSLGIPVVGDLLRKVAFARFSHYFGSLHEAGLEVAPSMQLVERLIGNAYLSHQFRRAVERVMAGDSLSQALRRVGQFPPIVIQMLALGERTGQMTKALEDVRKYFDREVQRTVKRSLTLFGPIMLVVLAGVFVTMALAFYLPLFQLLKAVR